MNKRLLAAIGLVVIGGAAVTFWRAPVPGDGTIPAVSTRASSTQAVPRSSYPADGIIVPDLSSAARMGQIAFDDSCAACHGAKAAGTQNGPPLIHKIYEPSHHADFSFVMAVKNGVRAHHWRFGDMVPVAGVTDKQIEWITEYVREMQRANGIR